MHTRKIALSSFALPLRPGSGGLRRSPVLRLSASGGEGLLQASRRRSGARRSALSTTPKWRLMAPTARPAAPSHAAMHPRRGADGMTGCAKHAEMHPGRRRWQDELCPARRHDEGRRQEGRLLLPGRLRARRGSGGAGQELSPAHSSGRTRGALRRPSFYVLGFFSIAIGSGASPIFIIGQSISPFLPCISMWCSMCFIISGCISIIMARWACAGRRAR